MNADSVAQLSAALDRGEVSAVELAQQCLQRIAASELNAFIDVQPDLTLAQARDADSRRAAGERGPLLGVPVAHKDLF
ncbi:MAG TPA: amidase family protein, partial [Burkholderiaceae bacterium]|nr:amidase family protein [Burkholderiaceae bacterium]